MNNLPAVNAFDKVRGLLDRMKPELLKALPRHVTPDRMVRVALTSFRKSPALLNCNPQSLAAAVMECAQLGLVPDGILGHAHLIPFKDEATVVIGYKGYIHLAMNTGRVTAVCPNVIREGDVWEYKEGVDRHLSHKPKPENDGEIIAFYSVVLFSNDQRDFRLMWKGQVDAIKKRAPGSKSKGGPWETDYVPMGMKTAIRQHMKYLSLSPEADRATSLDEMYDAGISQGLSLVDDTIDVTPEDENQGKIEDLTERLTTAKNLKKEHDDNQPAPEPEETPADKLNRVTWGIFADAWLDATDKVESEETLVPCELAFQLAKECVAEDISSTPDTQKTLKALAERIVSGTIDVVQGTIAL